MSVKVILTLYILYDIDLKYAGYQVIIKWRNISPFIFKFYGMVLHPKSSIWWIVLIKKLTESEGDRK